MSKKRDHKKYSLEVGKGLALISQLGISFLMPIFVLIWAARWAVNRWNWPSGVIIAALLLGVLVGGSSVWQLLRGGYSKK